MAIKKEIKQENKHNTFFLSKALQGQLNDLIDGIQDESNENTQLREWNGAAIADPGLLHLVNLSNSNGPPLVFKVLTLQEEVARLKKQENSQSEAHFKKIKGENLQEILTFIPYCFSYNLIIEWLNDKNQIFSLQDLENELEDIRSQIAEKTLLLDSRDLNFSNLCECFNQFWLETYRTRRRLINYLQNAETSFYFFVKRLKLGNFVKKSNHWKMKYQTSKANMLRTLQVSNQMLQLHCNMSKTNAGKLFDCMILCFIFRASSETEFDKETTARQRTSTQGCRRKEL